MSQGQKQVPTNTSASANGDTKAHPPSVCGIDIPLTCALLFKSHVPAQPWGIAEGGSRRAVTVERILRQKISKGVKEQMLARFDRNGDGTVSAAEFLNKIVANPMATLYAFMPSGVCLS